MKIAVDAMGGDNAPQEIVAGAVEAAREYNIHVILVGYRERIEHELRKYQIKNLPIYIQHASEVVSMDDSPSKALRRKKDSSLKVGIDLVRDGRAQGIISAGRYKVCPLPWIPAGYGVEEFYYNHRTRNWHTHVL